MKQLISGILGLCLSANVGAFALTSSDIAEGQTMKDKFVFNSHGCKGQNMSPALSWTDAPQGTKSFAVTVFDPDARDGKGWWHWVLINIPGKLSALPEGFGVMGIFNFKDNSHQLKTDFGTPGYGGPCPPVGDKPHHYIFTLYALKTEAAKVQDDLDPEGIDKLLKQQAIGEAKLTALYGREE